ncbi:pyridoxal phosphate-dependent aminotransferase [Anaeromyxobacter paludicola]|uniref:Aminotransferase class I/classII large domain-containing protein n=1 Tax=Anaeromyxobacter paludicola TaxID=2918171 RepID=A0ABN6NA90_9BACT|nr:pyridoxal phosphate-dependent aminotransferase [Anaeromyxobacter paludicola]BDG08872.1 hypothetical protein AMPC_19850 [Anaeromyxobacter paludicola]
MAQHIEGDLGHGGPLAGARDPRREELDRALARARGGARPLLDLADDDPARCGLRWDPEELREVLDAARAEPRWEGLREAQEAVAGYLAGRGAAVSPDRVRFAASPAAALALAVTAARPDPAREEVLCPVPAFALELPEHVRPRPYPLRYDGAWRIDRRALARGITGRTGAVVLGSPAEPTGAVPDREDLALLEDLCRRAEAALVADERRADEALAPGPSVAGLRGCLAFHLGSLAGACGNPGTDIAWIAAAGPEALAEAALARAAAVPGPAPDPVARRAVPALLGRRERFALALRERLSRNRAALATAALREAPWTLLQGGGGRWAVLQIGAAQDEHALCLELLDRGVRVLPGYLFGFAGNGFLAVSLLLDPQRFRAGLEVLEEQLRDGLLG